MQPIILPIPPLGYRPQSVDCSIESDLLQFELLRRWSPTRRLMQAASLMRSARQLSEGVTSTPVRLSQAGFYTVR
jgi:hypothetical protein